MRNKNGRFDVFWDHPVFGEELLDICSDEDRCKECWKPHATNVIAQVTVTKNTYLIKLCDECFRNAPNTWEYRRELQESLFANLPERAYD
jgi:hypothetical protein